MSIFSAVLAYLVAPFICLFLYWRSLRQDYSSDRIFESGFFMIILVLLFVFLGNQYLASGLVKSQIIDPDGLWFWFGFLGLVASLFYTNMHKKFKFFEVLEAITPGLISWVSITLLAKGVWAGGIYFVLVMFYFVLSKNYKRIVWYKSGKIGFSALATLGVFFLIRSGLAIYDPSMLSLAGRMDGVLSAGLSFLSFFSIYNLAYN